MTHDLTAEFPEKKAVIHRLKLENHHFARLHDEYESLNKNIEGIESHRSNVEDMTLEDMKKRRLHLKDELHKILQGAP